MWRRLGFTLLTVGTAFGSPYATNRDGSVLYFSSSLRAKGTSQYLHPKIFVWEPGTGVRLYEQRPLPDPDPTITGCPYKFYSLDAVDVSSDGSVVAVGGLSPGIPCYTVEQFQTTIYSGADSPQVLPGGAILSRNGRYAVLYSSVSPFLSNTTGVQSYQVVDLQTGQQTTYSGWGVGGPRLTNDGTLLLNNSSGLVLARGTQMTVLGLPTISGWINDAGTQVIYATYTQLFSYSVASHSSVLLADQPPSFVATSDDGSVVAFGGSGAGSQVFVVRSDGTGLRQLTDIPGGAYPVAISGDGTVVFATTYLTSAYRLVRIDVASGESSDIIGPTPQLIQTGPVGYGPGLLASVGGNGYSQETAQAQQPLPLSLGGLEVTIAGKATPLASVSPFGVRFQVPWDLPPGYSDLELHTSDSTASEFVAGLEVFPSQGEFFQRNDSSTRQGMYGPPILTAAHADFSGLVSDADPAKPGEIIHIYAQGLGAANPIPAPGVAAPSQPPSALAVSLICLLNTDPTTVFADHPIFTGVPPDVSFAGLAPQMFGVYQVDVTMPAAFQTPAWYTDQYPNLHTVPGYVVCRQDIVADTLTLIGGRLPLRGPGD
jgi:uncharacterized protein (TIGR03437 family)